MLFYYSKILFSLLSLADRERQAYLQYRVVGGRWEYYGSAALMKKK
jgi:hypothetical protein